MTQDNNELIKACDVGISVNGNISQDLYVNLQFEKGVLAPFYEIIDNGIVMNIFCIHCRNYIYICEVNTYNFHCEISGKCVKCDIPTDIKVYIHEEHNEGLYDKDG